VDSVSGIGVLDKAVTVLDALEAGPLTLGELVDATGLPRATAYRLAAALEVHAFVGRDGDGRFQLGPRLAQPALQVVARPALEMLRDATGESVQLYVRRGDRRLCIDALESPHGLRTIVPVGRSTWARPARSSVKTEPPSSAAGPRAWRSARRAWPR